MNEPTAPAVVHEITEIIISNVVPIVFLLQYARFENMVADARSDAA